MKYAQTFLVAILLISGTFIWYSFYSSFQEKKEEAAQQPAISSPSQEEETDAPPTEDQVREEKVMIPQFHQDGLTQQMVKEWNIEDERIGIDQLLSLLEKNKP
ncbi:hypothetical protein [Sutcliffiella horikoshii]|uniref:Uncharacterized protein n=1 Tax=Sutcliffiella horikoshii TaxID=79883 RepID=A0A5D4T7D6_9BACI|nr:hypothetical protein [Sutcliffiella horikoshii]TYS71543.1 hypothetical protein FZC75_13450 [Sutcliffiella horikoshii]